MEDGGLTQSNPATTWDQSATAATAFMPMLPENTTTDDVADIRGTASASSRATGCGGCCGSGSGGGGGGGKLATFFLVGIPMMGVVAAALAWFYSNRQVSSSSE